MIALKSLKTRGAKGTSGAGNAVSINRAVKLEKDTRTANDLLRRHKYGESAPDPEAVGTSHTQLEVRDGGTRRE